MKEQMTIKAVTVALSPRACCTRCSRLNKSESKWQLTRQRQHCHHERVLYDAPSQKMQRPSRRATERPSDRATERSSDRATERSSDRATERPSDRAIERQSDRATERPNDRAAERASDRAIERTSDRATKTKIEYSGSKTQFYMMTRSLCSIK